MHSQPEFALSLDAEIHTICNMNSCTFSFGYNIVSIRNMSIYFLEQTGILHNSAFNLWYANETSLGSFGSSLSCSLFSPLSRPPARNLEIRLGASSGCLCECDSGTEERGDEQGENNFRHPWCADVGFFFVQILCKLCSSVRFWTVDLQRFANEKGTRGDPSIFMLIGLISWAPKWTKTRDACGWGLMPFPAPQAKSHITRKNCSRITFPIPRRLLCPARPCSSVHTSV